MRCPWTLLPTCCVGYAVSRCAVFGFMSMLQLRPPDSSAASCAMSRGPRPSWGLGGLGVYFCGGGRGRRGSAGPRSHVPTRASCPRVPRIDVARWYLYCTLEGTSIRGARGTSHTLTRLTKHEPPAGPGPRPPERPLSRRAPPRPPPAWGSPKQCRPPSAGPMRAVHADGPSTRPKVGSAHRWRIGDGRRL